MVDVTPMPDNAFGYVPTPALVGADRVHHARAPTIAALGGHVDCIRPVESIRSVERREDDPLDAGQSLAADAAGGSRR